MDGHGESRIVVDHIKRRLPALLQTCTAVPHLIDIVHTLATETNHMTSGACISIAHLLSDGTIRTTSLGDSPVLWGPNDFQSIHDLSGLAPHGVSNNIRERTRIMCMGAKTRGQYMMSPCGYRLLSVTRALGDADFVPLIDRTPEYAETQLSEGDFIMLCTDGFCDLQLPLSKTRIDWKYGIAQKQDAKQLVKTHSMIHGMYDDTSVIVAYRY